MSLLSDTRKRWFLLALLWAAMLVIGITGFIKQGSAHGVDRGTFDNLYLTLQLATIDYSGSSGPMNWQLQLARFVVPILAASTILQTASVVFREEFRRYRLRYAKDHVIICGLGETGARLATAFVAAGQHVVAIEPDAAVAARSGVAEQVDHVLQGSGTDEALLRTAGIDRARRIVVCSGSDAVNVQITQVIARVSASRAKAPVRCAVQLGSANLTGLLRSADLESRGGARISYFNLHERAARALLADDGPPAVEEQAVPHLMILGLGQFGRSLVLALAQQWADAHPGVKLTPTLVDPSARGKWEALRLQHPALDDVCEPTLVDLDLEVPDPDAIDDFLALLAQDPPSWVAIAVADETTALAQAGFMHQHLAWGQVPIVVRMRTQSGLGGLLQPLPDGAPALPGVELFPFLDRTCTIATVDGGVREQLAEAVHEDYLAHLAPDAPTSSLARPWAELTDADRELSRKRVDGITADLDALGLDLVPLRRWGAPEVTLTADEVDQLAGRDHQRWFDDRTAAGWRHGEVRDDEDKRNPLLVPWEDLPDDARSFNRATADELLPMLARNGFEAARR
ncbi:NAD-binding protein [Aquihabitans sp. McL0605]|uniref:NAD-binding protein n=1 Tax=Aquihabitans sp. McL0605 TaxID=3415671 RepID=UPI003CF33B11